MAAVRKRNAYTRALAKRGRPRSPAPTTGWRIRELAQMTGVSVRTLRNYVTAGLLTPTELRGTATRYQRRELLRLVAVMRARKETKLSLADMKQKLDAVGDGELEAWVRAGTLPLAVSAALGIEPPPPPASASAPGPAARNSETAPSQALQRWTRQLEAWQRIQLLPGLELMLGPTASAQAVDAARKICSEYLG